MEHRAHSLREFCFRDSHSEISEPLGVWVEDRERIAGGGSHRLYQYMNAESAIRVEESRQRFSISARTGKRQIGLKEHRMYVYT